MKKKAFIRNLLISALLLVGMVMCAGCQDVSKVELIEDIDLYVNTIDRVHAEPYRLISRENFIGKAQELKQKIRALENARISVPQCALYLMELCALIQDEHTRINFPFNQLTGEEPVFPLKLKIIDGNSYVLDNLGYESVPNYCSIQDINGIPIETLFEKCCYLYNTSLDHAKYLMFEESFPLLLANYLDIPPPWAARYKMNSKAQVTELQEITSNAYLKQRTQQSNRYRSYSIFLNDVRIPVLDLPGFSYGKVKAYESFIDTFFQGHKNSRYLVIDVRQNRGGSGYWGFYLLDYLTDSAYRIAKKFEFKVSEMMRESIYASKAGNQLNHARNGEYLDVVNHQMRSPRTTPNKFRGKTFLLISENTFSAGVVFAAVFQANRMGLVVGQETSGRVRFASDPVTITLSNSNLKGSIPVAIYTLPGNDPDRGVLPDIKVSRTIDDYHLGWDKEMEKVKELIFIDMRR
ncbi:MAG: S41 family peptidase [Desulfobacterales bacterium]|jgi:hypothetical protein